jgi:guanylate kinase
MVAGRRPADDRRMTDELLLLIGPSGAGKSALAARLDADGLIATVPTWTTRPMRPDEVDAGSPNHRFVDEATFDALDAAGRFAGVVRLPGLPHRYALPRRLPAIRGRIPTVVARAPFVEAIRARFPAGRTLQIERPAGATLLALGARATSIEEVGARLRGAEAERLAGRLLAERVFVNDGSLDALVERVRSALPVGAAVAA